MRIAVSGAGGFVGRHLSRELARSGHEVIGVGLEPDLALPSLSQYLSADLTRGWPEAALRDVDAVIHLAALAAVGPSFSAPQHYLEANSAPVTQLGQALLAGSASPRVLLVSTAALYAPGVGLSETSPVRPTSPYAVSKLVGEDLAAYYRTRGLDVRIVRPFNHVGPDQGPGFLLPDLIAGVRRAVATGEPLRTGDLSTRRDYTDVRDVARAYRLLIEAESAPPLLNICSGVSISGAEMLHAVVSHLGIEPIPTEVDPGRLRPGDPREISGDASAAAAALGWEPRISFARTVGETVAAADPRLAEQPQLP